MLQSVIQNVLETTTTAMWLNFKIMYKFRDWFYFTSRKFISVSLNVHD